MQLTVVLLAWTIRLAAAYRCGIRTGTLVNSHFNTRANVALVSMSDLQGAPTPARLAQAKLEREEAERRRGELRAALRLGGAPILLVTSALLTGAPPGSDLLRVFTGSILCAAPGLVKKRFTLRYGYASSLVLQAALCVPQARTISARAMVLAYALSGLKNLAYHAARDVSPMYAVRVVAPTATEEALQRGTLARRARFTVLASFVISALYFPLYASTQHPSPLVLVGAIVAMLSMAAQTVADIQKWRAKAARGADALCREGLWAYSRHPNYLAELTFLCGALFGGLCGARSLSTALLVTLGPAACAARVMQATRELEAQQLEVYAGRLEYREYVRRTPRLFVGGTGEERDESREQIASREETEELASDIGNIVGVTGLAGVAAGVLGAIGYLLLM